MTIADIQIEALQKVVKVQDELLAGMKAGNDDVEISAVWRNECYRLSVRNQILQSECIAAHQRSLAAQDRGLAYMREELEYSVGAMIDQVEELVTDRIRLMEERIWYTQERLNSVQLVTNRQPPMVSEAELCPATDFELISSPRTPVERSTTNFPITDVDKQSKVQALLDELRDLESQAKRMLIKD